MATTICFWTLITKSAQWVIIRLGDYPIHMEKSNMLWPNHKETHPCMLLPTHNFKSSTIVHVCITESIMRRWNKLWLIDVHPTVSGYKAALCRKNCWFDSVLLQMDHSGLCWVTPLNMLWHCAKSKSHAHSQFSFIVVFADEYLNVHYKQHKSSLSNKIHAQDSVKIFYWVLNAPNIYIFSYCNV